MKKETREVVYSSKKGLIFFTLMQICDDFEHGIQLAI